MTRIARLGALALALLVLPACVTRYELVGEWDIALQRVTVGDQAPAEQADSGWLGFGETVRHAWIWAWDPVDRDFYAPLDPPILDGYASSTDLDAPGPITLIWSGGEINFMPEEDEEKDLWLVAEGIEWGLEAPLKVELLLEP